MKEKLQQVVNCTAKVKALNSDASPGDNAFKCPVIGAYVELQLIDGELKCMQFKCRNWSEDPEKQM